MEKNGFDSGKKTAAAGMALPLLLAGISLCATLLLVHIQRRTAPPDVDVNLAHGTRTLIFGALADMFTEPARYDGKTVRIHGALEIDTADGTGRTLYCTVQDTSACCTMGIAFEPQGVAGTDELPPETTLITVRGTFARLGSGAGSPYGLRDAVIEHQYPAADNANGN